MKSPSSLYFFVILFLFLSSGFDSAYAGIFFDGSLGTNAPPTTVGSYIMTPFPTDNRPLLNLESIVNSPSTCPINFSNPGKHCRIGDLLGWSTWSHGYTGDVYSYESQTITINLPAKTNAFYCYVEPNTFNTFSVKATANDGTNSGFINVNGFQGATGFAFYTNSPCNLTTITITVGVGSQGFAIGEFGININCQDITPTVNSLICTNVIEGHEGQDKNHPVIDPKVTFYEDLTPYVNNDLPIKVCADGSNATYFKVNVSDVTGINFQILDGDQVLVDAIKGTSTNIEKFGKLGTPYSFGNDVEVIYTHPEYIGDDVKETARHLKLQILKNETPLDKVLFPLDIYRAPIVFVHGLWGDFNTFKQIREELINNQFYPGNLQIIRPINVDGAYSQIGLPVLGSVDNIKLTEVVLFNPLMHLVDYYQTSGSHFYTNAYKNVVANGIDSVFKTARINGYSCGKAMLVCHSMGGILSRLYLQSTYQSTIQYRFDIQKLITINTPHYGTQMANYLLTEDRLARTAVRIKNLDLNDVFDAVSDLEFDSKSIKDLNIELTKQNKVPSQVIATVVSDNEKLTDEVTSANLILSRICKRPFILGHFFYDCKDIFNNDLSDLIVPEVSQRADFIEPLTDLFRFHVNSPGSSKVINKIKILIDSDPNNSINFYKTGFKPGMLEPYNISHLENNLKRIINDSIKIINIKNGDTFNSGDSIRIKFKYSPGIDNFKLYLTGGTNSFFEGYANKPDSIILFKSDSTELGNRILYLFGYDASDNFICFDSVQIIFKTNLTLDSIRIFPRTIKIPLGYSDHFTIQGYFHDGTKVDLINIPNLQVLFDTSKLVVDKQYKVQGKNGSNKLLLEAIYLDKRDTILIQTTSNSINNITYFTSDKYAVCQGNKILFKDASLGENHTLFWNFPGGIPASSNSLNLNVIYNTPGSYDVTLISVYPDKTDTLTIKNYVTVSPLPVVNFGKSNQSATYITGLCSVTLDAGNPGSSFLWNTGESTQAITVFKTGSYSVTVTNSNGCSTTGIIFANITDKIKPKVLTQNTSVYLDGSGQVEINPNSINKGSSDNCGIKTLSVSPQFLSCKNKGLNKVTLTAIDGNGNSSTATAMVNVLDLELPKMTCPPDITVTTKPNQCAVATNSVILGSPSNITDNCAIKYPVTRNSVSSYPVGITNINWTVSDSSLNTATCTQKVIVIANICGLPIKVTNIDSTSTTAKIKWQGATCATDFQVSYREELTDGVWGSWSTLIGTSTNNLSYQFTGLKSNKYYNYQVRTKCGTTYSTSVFGYIHTKPGIKSDDFQNRNSKTNKEDSSVSTKIEIIPNPAKNNTIIFIQGFEKYQKEVTMMDLNGKLAFKVNVGPKDNQLELDLEALSVHSGIYLIRVSDCNRQKYGQLVIER